MKLIIVLFVVLELGMLAMGALEQSLGLISGLAVVGTSWAERGWVRAGRNSWAGSRNET